MNSNTQYRTSRRFKDIVIKAFDDEGQRLAPRYAQSLSETLVPLALDSTVNASTRVLQEQRVSGMNDIVSRETSTQNRTANKTTIGHETTSNISPIENIESIDESRTKVLQLADAFSIAEQRGSNFSAMLTSTAAGIGTLFATSNSSDSNKILASLLKDLGVQAITGVQGLLLAAEAQSAVKGILSFGASLIEDAPLIAAAYLALEGAKGYINSLDSGGIVMGDQLIQAHDRETVIPFDKAPAFFADAVNHGAGAKDVVRDVYRPEHRIRTSSFVRISFGELRNALILNDTIQSSRSF